MSSEVPPNDDIAERSGLAIAEAVLGRLLDDSESNSERHRRIIRPVPKVSLLYDELGALRRTLLAAEAANAVELICGKHSERDHIVKVALRDPEPLYALLRREKPAVVAASAARILADRLAGLSPGLEATLARVTAAWAQRRNLLRDLGPSDVDKTVAVFRAAEGLIARRAGQGMDMRTFSRRYTGHSKIVENNVGRIADVLRMTVELPEYLDATEVLEAFGIQKFPHPCLVSGPVTYKGVRLPTEPFVGIAPEMAVHMGVADAPRWLLTIENLASFNRQVREASAPNGIVIYTGGFPSDSTLATILELARQVDCPILHWGDIDAGGVKIAYRLEHALRGIDRELSLHLMVPEIALTLGQPVKPESIFKLPIDPSSCVYPLQVFLASDDAASLEQEELDPVVPMP